MGVCKVIGFVGIDKYEIVLYLSQIIKNLGRSVLISDSSVYGALDDSISYVKEKSSNEIINYMGINYINTIREEKVSYNCQEVLNLEENKEKYDFILIDFGFDVSADIYNLCDSAFIVTDMQKHNIRRAGSLADKINIPYSIIIKDMIKCKISSDYLAKSIQRSHPAQMVYTVYKDTLDEEYKLKCQYNTRIGFKKLSKDFRNMLIAIVKSCNGDIEEKTITKALRMAESGR